MSKWVFLVILLQSVHCLQMQNQDPQCEKASLNLQRWATLVHSTHMINSAIGTNHSVHLGGSVYAETFYMSDNVHITKYEKTKQGKYAICLDQNVKLSSNQFKTIIAHLDHIEYCVPELSIIRPCYLNDDHQNQMGYFQCSECNPDQEPDLFD